MAHGIHSQRLLKIILTKEENALLVIKENYYKLIIFVLSFFLDGRGLIIIYEYHS